MGELKLVPLHVVTSLLPSAVTLLNHQWPRSESSRLASLSHSCDDLPTHFAFVSTELTNVVGFASLCRVADPLSQSILIENVIIENQSRSKGYGKRLMEATEAYAKKMGFNLAYLSTTDKESFYSRLGYQICDPVTVISANSSLMSEDRLTGLMHLFGGSRKVVLQEKAVIWMKKCL